MVRDEQEKEMKGTEVSETVKATERRNRGSGKVRVRQLIAMSICVCVCVLLLGLKRENGLFFVLVNLHNSA